MLRLLISLIFVPALANAAPGTASAADCNHMEVWDYAMAMCMPFPMAGMPMRMAMFQGNAFLKQTSEQGPRGRQVFSSSNFFMGDVGSSVGDRQYVNLDVMGTFEKWTLPTAGDPNLLQIGEEQADGTPFVDAQHPHSSPLMGLTLSDTIALGAGKDFVKLWFSPRGASTEGPVAFMHRPTGQVNPDAPLGHHIGQDVGHISSTVFGAALRRGDTTLEISNFYGAEPQPTAVDLPMGSPNSWALRLTQEFSPRFFAMASAAFIHSPEANEPDVDQIQRYSASFGHRETFGENWIWQDFWVWGNVHRYDGTDSLTSWLAEFRLDHVADTFWGRAEVLQRTADELLVTGDPEPDRGRWVTALTLGYTRTLAQTDHASLGLGASVTKDFLPSEFHEAYDGDPWSGKIFLQISGMQMWDL